MTWGTTPFVFDSSIGKNGQWWGSLLTPQYSFGRLALAFHPCQAPAIFAIIFLEVFAYHQLCFLNIVIGLSGHDHLLEIWNRFAKFLMHSILGHIWERESPLCHGLTLNELARLICLALEVCVERIDGLLDPLAHVLKRCFYHLLFDWVF